MSKDYLAAEEQFILARRFVEWGGTSFGMGFFFFFNQINRSSLYPVDKEEPVEVFELVV